MAACSTAEEVALYQLSMGNQHPEPHMSVPHSASCYELPYHPATRRSNAGVEQWLTAESPVARATNIESHQRPSFAHRLPSLSSNTLLPESFDYAADIKYDSAIMHGFGMPDLPLEHPAHHLRMSEVDNSTQHISPPATWNVQDEYDSDSSPPTPIYSGRNHISSRGMIRPVSPYYSPGLFDESPMYSPCSSAPDLYHPTSSNHEADPYPNHYGTGLPMQIPRSFPVNEAVREQEEVSGGKPYAQLIQECLLSAPGHRMMLRDIYDWFERNTTKPSESGGNGWQNSIRHNLSMNKVSDVSF
jgi:hypothetical protein